MPESPLPPPPAPIPTLLARVVARLPAGWSRLAAAAAAGASVAVAVTVGVVAVRGAPGPTPGDLVLPRAAPGVTAGEGATGEPGPGPGAGAGDGPSAPGRSGAESYVHVAGAVGRPGVYRVRAGGRVSDVVDAAGGPAPDADLDRVNLAAKVSDGERVYVPRRGETAPPEVAAGAGAGGAGAGGAGAPAARLDLNTATAEQLDALPGIGPATAAAIVEHRRTHGRFASVDELLEVRGIGEAKLAALRSRVRV